MRRSVIVGVFLALLASLLPVAGAAAASERCFAETGFCISGPIRAYWEKNGGLPVFGYPIGSLHTETIEGSWTGPTQLFERDRLEDHSDQGQGVLAGRLGALLLEQQGRPWQMGGVTAPSRGCQLFEQTGYQACGKFLSYWQRAGGLARFGYPITAEISETIGGNSYTVQYFERRRMELHPENAGSPYEVLLGLLGHEVSGLQQPNQPCAVSVLSAFEYLYERAKRITELGCAIPGEDYPQVNAAYGRFERGLMVWLELRGGRRVIYVLAYQPDNSISWQVFDDTWHEGDPNGGDLKPPPGMAEPDRGFGKVWREQPGVRAALGWALQQAGAQATAQVFERGTLVRLWGENPYWSQELLFTGYGKAFVIS